MIKLSISIDVSDIKKAEEFYTQALGCKREREQFGMIVLSVENCEIYLQEKQEGTNPLIHQEAKRNYNRHWTPVHLDFLAKNVDEIVEKVKQLGGKHEGGDSWEGGSIAYCCDPFGNGFCIINE